MQSILFGFHFIEVKDEEFESIQNNNNNNSIVKNVPKSWLGISEKSKYKWSTNTWKIFNFISNQEHVN